MKMGHAREGRRVNEAVAPALYKKRSNMAADKASDRRASTLVTAARPGLISVVPAHDAGGATRARPGQVFSLRPSL
jgi:hypothetical protein